MFLNESSKSPISKGRVKKRHLTQDLRQTFDSVIWGIDSNEDDIWHFHKVRDILRLWTGSDEKIFPVSILSPADFEPDVWPRSGLSDFRQELKFEIKERIGDFLEKIAFSKERMKVLFIEKDSKVALVERFLRFASRENAEMIALFSQPSHQSKMMGLGSFSELAIATSKIPVMILTEESQVPDHFKIFLFSTDFSPARKKAFKETLRWAKRKNAQVILYHQVGTPITPGMMAALGAPMDAVWIEGLWNTEQERIMKLADEWLAEARLANVQCRIEREVKVGGWSERVSEVAQAQNANVIVIPIKRRRWQQMLFGGQIRKVVSTATCPLIFYQSS